MRGCMATLGKHLCCTIWWVNKLYLLLFACKKLPTAYPTRWNSTYDCLSALVFRNLGKLSTLCTRLEVEPFIKGNIDIAKHYLTVIKPICISLYIFQGESNYYVGCILPVLKKLKQKLGSPTLPFSCKDFCKKLVVKFEERFGHKFSQRELIIPTYIHPAFKLTWLD